jgi:hypothetical protein
MSGGLLCGGRLAAVVTAVLLVLGNTSSPADPAASPRDGTRQQAAPPSRQMLPPARVPQVNNAVPPRPTPPQSAAQPAPILVLPGPNGITIASEDTAALDELERLLTALHYTGMAGGRKITVFYLKHAKATAIAEMLTRVLSGMASETAASGAREAIRIIPDNRLNALLVQASSADVQTIERLVKILDAKNGPAEVAVVPKPRMIPLYNAQAQDVAVILRQVYADRLVEAVGAARGMMPFSPALMMMMQQQGGPEGFRGGGPEVSRGGPEGFPGSSGRSGQQRDERAKMSIGVAARTNSLIVAAPDPLFEEVKQLVTQLDAAARRQPEKMTVVALHKTNPSAMERALVAFAGDAVRITHTSQPETGGQPFGRQMGQPGVPQAGLQSFPSPDAPATGQSGAPLMSQPYAPPMPQFGRPPTPANVSPGAGYFRSPAGGEGLPAGPPPD